MRVSNDHRVIQRRISNQLNERLRSNAGGSITVALVRARETDRPDIITNVVARNSVTLGACGYVAQDSPSSKAKSAVGAFSHAFVGDWLLAELLTPKS